MSNQSFKQSLNKSNHNSKHEISVRAIVNKINLIKKNLNRHLNKQNIIKYEKYFSKNFNFRF